MNIRLQRFRLDEVIAMAFLLVMASGLVLCTGRVPRTLGLPLHEWGALHRLSSAVLVLGVAAHLLMHWKWIKGVCHLRAKPAKVRRHLRIDWALLLLFLLVLSSAPDGLSPNLTAFWIHLISGLAMTVLVLVHAGLHHTWIASTWALPRNRRAEGDASASLERQPTLFGE